MAEEAALYTSGYRQLRVWQAAVDLAVATQEALEASSKRVPYSLMDQVVRSSISVVSNIAEGNARTSRPEYLRFLSYSQGSLAELDTQMLIACRRGFIDGDLHHHFETAIASLRRQPIALQQRLAE